MNEYERVRNGVFMKYSSDNEDEFLRKILPDVVEGAIYYMPFDVEGVDLSASSLDDALKRVTKIKKALKEKGLSNEEIKFVYGVLVLKSLIDLGFIERDEGDFIKKDINTSDYVHYIVRGRKLTVKRFNFSEKTVIYDKYRAYISILSSIITKLCRDEHEFSKGKKALKEFLEMENKDLCALLEALMAAKIPVKVDLKKYDKYVNSIL